jgi:hypothetical protein
MKKNMKIVHHKYSAMETTVINKMLQKGSAPVKELSDSESDMLELHFSYILES